MKLFQSVSVYGGGPGSGCNPEAAKAAGNDCGRPPGTGSNTPASNSMPPMPRFWHNYRNGSVIFGMYEKLRDQQWHSLDELNKRWGHDAVTMRLRTLRQHGDRNGHWELQRVGTNVRLVRRERQQQPAQTPPPPPTSTVPRTATPPVRPASPPEPPNPAFRKASGSLSKALDKEAYKVAREAKVYIQSDRVQAFYDTFKFNPVDYKDIVLKGLTEEQKTATTVSISGHGTEWTLSLENAQFSQTRRFFLGPEKSVYHSSWSINSSQQAQGLGKQIFQNQLDLYDHLGIKKISVSAGSSVGGYAWARYGFVPTQSSWDMIRRRADERAAYYPPEIRAKVKLITSISSPRGIWLLAGMTDKVGRDGKPVGKDILLGSAWSGSIDLSNEENYSLLRSYVGGKIKLTAAAEPYYMEKGKKQDASFHEPILNNEKANELFQWWAIGTALELGWTLEKTLDVLGTPEIVKELTGRKKNNVEAMFMEPVSTFHPPSLKNAKRLPADNPGEKDDTYMDVTKREEAQKDRLERAKRHPSQLGVPPPVQYVAARGSIKQRPAKRGAMRRTFIPYSRRGSA